MAESFGAAWVPFGRCCFYPGGGSEKGRQLRITDLVWLQLYASETRSSYRATACLQSVLRPRHSGEQYILLQPRHREPHRGLCFNRLVVSPFAHVRNPCAGRDRHRRSRSWGSQLRLSGNVHFCTCWAISGWCIARETTARLRLDMILYSEPQVSCVGVLFGIPA